MAQVHRLTAKNCLYFLRGHCTKSQNAHPPEEGYCLLIVERKKIGRQALDRLRRLERFDLSHRGSDRTVAEKYIVDRNLKEMAKVHCKNFIDSGVNFPPCLHQVSTGCTLKMKRCAGRCPEYEIDQNNPQKPH
jgi:hypothetical protein